MDGLDLALHVAVAANARKLAMRFGCGNSSAIAKRPRPQKLPRKSSDAVHFGWLKKKPTLRLWAEGTVTEPFRCLGFVSYESHEGERPMAIRWRLEREIPAAGLPVMGLAV